MKTQWLAWAIALGIVVGGGCSKGIDPGFLGGAPLEADSASPVAAADTSSALAPGA